MVPLCAPICPGLTWRGLPQDAALWDLCRFRWVTIVYSNVGQVLKPPTAFTFPRPRRDIMMAGCGLAPWGVQSSPCASPDRACGGARIRCLPASGALRYEQRSLPLRPLQGPELTSHLLQSYLLHLGSPRDGTPRSTALRICCAEPGADAGCVVCRWGEQPGTWCRNLSAHAIAMRG